jgi:hypothetical protein
MPTAVRHAWNDVRRGMTRHEAAVMSYMASQKGACSVSTPNPPFLTNQILPHQTRLQRILLQVLCPNIAAFTALSKIYLQPDEYSKTCPPCSNTLQSEANTRSSKEKWRKSGGDVAATRSCRLVTERQRAKAVWMDRRARWNFGFSGVYSSAHIIVVVFAMVM